METALVALAMVGLGMVAGAAAMLFTRRKLDSLPQPEIGANFRLRAITGVYRSKFVAFEADGWRLTPPLQRNQYVPLKPGDMVTVEAPTRGGVYLYRARILRLLEESHELVVAAPRGLRPFDRRQEFRLATDKALRLDGEPAALVDLSRQGARLRGSLRFRRGDRVKLEFDEVMVFAWVLDTWPSRAGEDFPSEIRVRFEEEIHLPVPEPRSRFRVATR